MWMTRTSVTLLLSLALEAGATETVEGEWETGAMLYQRYCATCHGPDGAGDGPAAGALRDLPADLRRLAARHDGRYPQRLVRRSLDGRGMPLAHGTREMPIWGRQWRRDGTAGNEAEIDATIVKLNSYLRSIQE